MLSKNEHCLCGSELQLGKSSRYLGTPSLHWKGSVLYFCPNPPGFGSQIASQREAQHEGTRSASSSFLIPGSCEGCLEKKLIVNQPFPKHRA